MLELKDHVASKSNQVIARRRPGNKGRRYPADPPRVEEIVGVMRQAGTDLYGRRLRGLIIVLWRAGLRISEALSEREERRRQEDAERRYRELAPDDKTPRNLQIRWAKCSGCPGRRWTPRETPCGWISSSTATGSACR